MYVFSLSMAEHYKWYASEASSIVPWNARYEYPTEANKATKTTPRIPPKNGSEFIEGNTIRLEFPAQGYINPTNFTIEFDVTLQIRNHTVGAQSCLYIQNNIHSLFTRLRLMYGATPLEDIIGSNFLVRQLTEWTTSPASYTDQTSVAQGIAGFQQIQPIYANRGVIINARKIMHSVMKASTTDRGMIPPNDIDAITTYPAGSIGDLIATRRYQIQLPFGLMTQSKYIPVKFMASQLAIELTLAPKEQCLILNRYTNYNPGSAFSLENGTPSYIVKNVNMIPEMLEFDASYDAEFLSGLQKGGVPIAFSSWHNFPYPQGGGTLNNIVIQEKSRSVKAIFAMIKLEAARIEDDSHATFAGLGGTLDSYQYRIGGRFYPASPVICSGWETTQGAHNGACEAYVELQKCLNILGDARLSTAITHERWARPLLSNATITGGNPTVYNDAYAPLYQNCSDGLFKPSLVGRLDTGQPVATLPATNAYCTESLSSVFCMSTCLETTNGRELSGLNAEEQSDITLLVKFSNINTTTFGSPRLFNYEIYTYYDAMLMLRENNVVQLVT